MHAIELADVAEKFLHKAVEVAEKVGITPDAREFNVRLNLAIAREARKQALARRETGGSRTGWVDDDAPPDDDPPAANVSPFS